KRAAVSSNRRRGRPVGGRRLGAPEHQRGCAGLPVDDYRVADAEPALQDLERERILHEPLDRTLERPCTERRVVALLRDELAGGRRDLQRDLAAGEETLHSPELDVHDALQLLPPER